jgi:hypothetical protein
MKVDLVGKIKNTQLPRSKALLPMFEAVVNSFQAIEHFQDLSSFSRTSEISIPVSPAPTWEKAKKRRMTSEPDFCQRE